MILHGTDSPDSGRIHPAWTASRESCPTCGARRRGEPTCARCRTDLALLMSLESQSDELLRAGFAAYRNRRHRTGMALARNALSVELTTAGLRLLALSSLRAGDFETAFRAARKAMGRTP